MTRPNKQQLVQSINIMDTILEASKHFFNLIKKKEVNQSIYIYSSIVEGLDVISKVITASNNKVQLRDKDKIEKQLLLIAQQLENGNLVKVAEILQFSLIPSLKKLHQSITESADISDENNIITIGVFASQRNPREFYTEDRVKAMTTESIKQHTRLLFFTSSDVNFAEKEIEADVWEDGKWQRIKAPFPDVINNAGAGKKLHTERKLQRQIPFTSFHVGNKFTLPQRMVQYRKFAELLVPFRVCTNEEKIYGFLEENNRVVFKALRGNRGENIYFITKKGNRYVMLDQKKERILNQHAFQEWLKTTILSVKGSYIIQRYIHTRTKDDEPYHIRAHMQKDGNGEWILTHIYPRVGNKKSNLSNISTEGRIEDLHSFLVKEYGTKGKQHEENILNLSMDLARHLDKLYGLALDELGIDLAIDETGRYWMHETNNGPQTAFHEEKRAVNTIAYAKYIAKNGIVKSNHSKKIGLSVNQFQASTTNYPFVETDDIHHIGLLVKDVTNDNLAIQCAQMAKQGNVHFFLFAPEDIDYDEMLIRGSFYENDAWVTKIVEYPDVIIDQLKMRGTKQAQVVYEELEDIPFTNEWPQGSRRRSVLYQKLQSNNDLIKMAPYQEVTKVRNIFQFLEKYEEVLIKPDIGSANHNQVKIKSCENGKYMVTIHKTVKEYRELSLRYYLQEYIKNKQVLVQLNDTMSINNYDNFTIQAHLMKNGNGEWGNVSHYVNMESHENNTPFEKQEELEVFLEDSGIQSNLGRAKDEIASVEKEVVITLENICEENISDTIITFAIDGNQNLILLDVNPSGPEEIHDVSTYAMYAIPYARSIVELEKEKVMI